MLCAYTRPRYQVSVYRTISPLVILDQQHCDYIRGLTIVLWTVGQQFQDLLVIKNEPLKVARMLGDHMATSARVTVDALEVIATLSTCRCKQRNFL